MCVCRFDGSSLIGRRCSLPCRARPTTLYIWWPGLLSFVTHAIDWISSRLAGPRLSALPLRPFILIKKYSTLRGWRILFLFSFCLLFLLIFLLISLLGFVQLWLDCYTVLYLIVYETKEEKKSGKLINDSMSTCGREKDVINNRRHYGRRRARQAKTTNQFLLMVIHQQPIRIIIYLFIFEISKQEKKKTKFFRIDFFFSLVI